MSLPLINAIRRFDHLGVTKHLTYKTVNIPDNKKKSPLMHALLMKNEYAIGLILRKNPIVYNDNHNNNIIHYAADNPSEIFQLLVEKYPSLIENSNDDLNRPIHFVTRHCIGNIYSKNIDILLDKNVDVNVFDKNGHSPLDISYMCEDTEIFRKLIRYGADPGIGNIHGKSMTSRLKVNNSLTETARFLERAPFEFSVSGF